MVVAAQDTDARVFGEAAVVLHVKPAGRVGGTRDLVHALAELDEGIREEPGADTLVGGRECLAAILTQVVAAGRDAQVHPILVPEARVQAEPAVPGLPLARVLVVADARAQLPGIAAVAASEKRRRFD